MKKSIPKIAICLLLGLITTIAVAWACAVLLPVMKSDLAGRALTSKEAPCWWLWRYQRPGACWIAGYPIISTESPSYLLQEHCEDGVLSAQSIFMRGRFADPPSEKDQESLREQSIAAHGWPLLAMWCEIKSDWTWNRNHYNLKEVSGGEVDSTNVNAGGVRIDKAAIGFRPMWFPFFLDSLFYAVLWAITFIAFSTTRKLLLWPIRKIRKRCLKCGYDLRGNISGGGCPECGCGR